MMRLTVRAPLICVAVTLLATTAGCGAGGRESLSDCRESETGYKIQVQNSGLSCEEVSIILGLIGSAEHGMQEIKGPEGAMWHCKAFPNEPGAVKYICK